MPVLTGCEVGDVIINHNFRNDNPKRLGFFVKENGVMHLIDEHGYEWTIPNDKGAKLEVFQATKFKLYMAECRARLLAVKEVMK